MAERDIYGYLDFSNTKDGATKDGEGLIGINSITYKVDNASSSSVNGIFLTTNSSTDETIQKLQYSNKIMTSTTDMTVLVKANCEFFKGLPAILDAPLEDPLIVAVDYNVIYNPADYHYSPVKDEDHKTEKPRLLLRSPKYFSTVTGEQFEQVKVEIKTQVEGAKENG